MNPKSNEKNYILKLLHSFTSTFYIFCSNEKKNIFFFQFRHVSTSGRLVGNDSKQYVLQHTFPNSTQTAVRRALLSRY